MLVPVSSTNNCPSNTSINPGRQVFCIAGTDPSNFIACMFSALRQETSLYVRGDDMPDFPARELCERLMPITFLPYTQGVSTTKLRKDIYNCTQSDPRLDLDVNLFYWRGWGRQSCLGWEGEGRCIMDTLRDGERLRGYGGNKRWD